MNFTIYLLFIAPEEWATTHSSLKAPPSRSARGGYREHPYGRYWGFSSPVTSPQRQFIACGLHINNNMTSNSPFFFVPILGITAHDCTHIFLVFPLYSWHDNDTIIILQDRLKKMLASIVYKPSFSRMILSGLFSLLYVIFLSLSLSLFFFLI